MHVCAQIFCIVILYWNHVIKCTIEAMRLLFGWFVLGGWSLDMVVYQIYIVEAICKYVYVMRGILCPC